MCAAAGGAGIAEDHTYMRKVLAVLIIVAAVLAICFWPAAEAPEPASAGSASVTPIPTPSPTPSPTPTPTPTPSPTPTPTPTPIPTATTEPVQPVIPQGEVIGSGSFTSDTGTPLNLRADWTATVLDSERVEVTVNVYLVSYQIEVRELYNAVNVSVGDQYASADSPAIKWENNTRLETLLASTVHTLSLPSGSSASFPLAAQYQFGGTYSKVELPVIECGGTIELSR